MKLTKETTTQEVKESFHKEYPYLKIEFYNKKHVSFEGSLPKNTIVENVSLGELNPKMRPGEIEMDENLTVNAFESRLENDFGLHVQVFRKSGDYWLQTNSTDNWTLGKQEEKGEMQEKFLNG